MNKKSVIISDIIKRNILIESIILFDSIRENYDIFKDKYYYIIFSAINYNGEKIKLIGSLRLKENEFISFRNDMNKISHMELISKYQDSILDFDIIDRFFTFNYI